MAFRVTMLLADSAQVSENKLYVLGGGWDVTGPEPTPFAIAMLIQISWDQSNRRHNWQLELVDADGGAIEIQTPMGSEEPVSVSGQFEVGRPPGVAAGSWLALPIAIQFAPLPVLEPGGRYEWRLSIGTETNEDWRLPFAVRQAPDAPA
jgi:hypothetical protein